MATISKPILDYIATRGSQNRVIDLGEVFTGAGLTYSVQNTNSGIAAATIQDGKLIVDYADALGHTDLRITATDANGQSVSENVRIRVAGENAYTIAVMPDTQDYTDTSLTNGRPETFYAMTDWLVANKDSLAIQFVTHVGDVTQNNQLSEWTIAEAAMRKLDGKIAYSLLPGNHDIAAGGTATSRTVDNLSAFFTVEEQSKLPGFGGVYDKEPTSFQNNFYTFTAPDGTKWLSLSIEFGPRDDVLRWAGDVIEGHLDHRVMITTHGYMAGDGRVGPITSQLTGENAGPSYGVGNDVRGSADGDAIWTNLASKYPNVAFTFSGHNFLDGAETQIDYNSAGEPVLQMLVNYQNGIAREITGNGDPAKGNAGGNGAIRLITIDPDNNAVYTGTYFVNLDDYLDGFRSKEESDRDGLTGSYRGHQEVFLDIDLSTPTVKALAKAGLDLSVDAGAADRAVVTLDASASIVPAGAEVTYAWKDADGRVVAAGAAPGLDLASGQHVLTLEVTDADGFVSRDEIRVMVSGQGTLLADNFNDGNRNGWSRPDAPKLAEYGSPADFGLPALPGGDADVLKFPKYNQQQGLLLQTNATAPAGDGLLFSYSIVMDVLVQNGQPWTALFQTQPANTNDADIYIRNDNDGTGSLGINGVYQGDFKYGEWQRVGITVERQGTSNTVVLKKYIEGQLVGTQTVNDANRFSIYTDQRGLLLFTDDNGETSGGHVNSMLFSDRVLSGAEMMGFGKADADGISATPIAGASQFDFTDGSLAPSFGPGNLAVKGATGDSSPFVVVGTVQSGQANGEGALKDLSNSGTNVLIWNEAAARQWSDYVYDITLSTTDSSGRIGVVFNYLDQQNHYRLTFDVSGNARTLVKVQNGTETVLATASHGLIMGEEVDLRVVSVDGAIRVFLDGGDVFDGPVIDTAPLASGTVGVISTTQDTAVFDNVTVNEATLTAHGAAEARAVDEDGDGRAQVSVTAAGSFGPDAIASYRWLIGDTQVGAGQNAVVDLPVGTTALTLEVTDANGKVSTDLVAIETVAKDKLLLSERFDGALSGWQLVNEGENGIAATWRIQNGALVQDADISSRQLTSEFNASSSNVWATGWSPLGDGDYVLRKGTYALYESEGAAGWKNYSVEATLKGGSADAMGLLFYYQDSQNYYKVELDAQYRVFQMTRVVDGIESVVARTAGTYAPGDALRLRVDIKDNVINVMLDGEPVFENEIEDRNHPGGTVALYNWGANGGVSYDDVTVVSLTGDIVGTAGDDTLAGTAGDDVIRGLAGDDIVSGLIGNDALDGGAGDDILKGGAGSDILAGGEGDDALDGGAGDDVLSGGAGDDVLTGGDGRDTADYSADSAGVTVNLASGAAFGDAIGEDKLSGIEIVISGAGDDTLIGDDSANRLNGGLGNDVIAAEAGDDVIVAGPGNDRVDGGDGSDTLDLSAATGPISVDFAGGKAIGAGVGSQSFSNIENLLFGASEDIVTGGNGNDAFDGGAGNDTLKGGAGGDTLSGGLGDDNVDGGSGDDQVSGGAGKDVLKGGSGIDLIKGDDGDDIIDAGSEADTIHGGSGNDQIKGGSGDDVITGGVGDDLLSGGSGSDTFVFAAGFGRDVITDLRDTDIIQFDTEIFADIAAVMAVATQVGDDVVFSITAQQTLTLEDVALSSLGVDDFRFVA